MFVPAEVMSSDAQAMGRGEIDDGVGVFPVIASFFRVDGAHFHGVFRGEAIELLQDQRCIRAGDIDGR